MTRSHKYHARKTVVDGETFDSALEAKWFAELRLRERAGEIRGLIRPPAMPLIVNGLTVGSYKPDASWYENGDLQHGDFKGFDTQQSALRRKLVLALYGIRVRVFTTKGEKKVRRLAGEPKMKKGRRRANDDPAQAPA